MDTRAIHKLWPQLKKQVSGLDVPWLENMVQQSFRDRDPFKVLISCILSLRTQDRTTGAASERLFNLAPDVKTMSKLPMKTIEKAIYPVGFYKVKAQRIKELCKALIKNCNSKVPDDLDELMKLKGVGRKTANLVITLGYQKPGICVDTHVHRITNRWGYVKTKTPEQTEFALREKIPQEYWLEINGLLVAFGQGICRPVSPLCSKCSIEKYCEKVGVTIHR
ncbi:MAG: endonuclease III [Nitrospirae bacterium]|nr:endonuclease III [Nitrospirota bacterium]